MSKFNLIATYARWFVLGFSIMFLLYQNYEMRRELNICKSIYADVMMDVNMLNLSLHDFTEMAPREMERIASGVVKDELEKLSKLEKTKE